MPDYQAIVLAGGSAAAPALVIDPLSFWGGCSPSSGEIIDPHHPHLGASVAGRCLVMRHGAGSSSSASVLAEALHNGVGPAAIVLERPDGILFLGAAVAEELYGEGCPILVLEAATERIPDGALLEISTGGAVSFTVEGMA